MLSLVVLLALGFAPGVALAREFPDTTNGIFVFDDQLDTSAMTDVQFAFAALGRASAGRGLPTVGGPDSDHQR